jgi:circadian clock protein KaiC
MIRHEVEKMDAEIVMIDSISGYRLAIQEQAESIAELRSLFKYLSNMGVTVIAVNEVESIVGDFKATELGISYMCDNVIFIRYLEIQGEMRKAIGILKKRMSDFERNLREFLITQDGVVIGKPLKNLRGILRGIPEWVAGGSGTSEHE